MTEIFPSEYYCEVCKCKHFPLDWYRRWLHEHGDKYKEFKTGKRRMTKQSGYISGETLWSTNDPLLWVDISTWTYSDQWKKWEVAPEHKEMQAEIDSLLIASEKVSIFNIVR